MDEIKITCKNEQALNIYEKKCLNGTTCNRDTDCDHCDYYTENMEFDITDTK